MKENRVGETTSLTHACVQKRAHPDLNQGPADLQSAALTTELCTRCARYTQIASYKNPMPKRISYPNHNCEANVLEAARMPAISSSGGRHLIHHPIRPKGIHDFKTVWPSGLRRWLQAPVRKGVGSNPTAVIFRARDEARECFAHQFCMCTG